MVVRLVDGRIVPLDRNWLELFVFALGFAVGANRLVRLALGIPVDPAAGIHLWLDITWHVLVVVGGTLAWVGAWRRNPYAGVRTVAYGLWPLAAGAILYSGGLALHGQEFPAGVYAGFAIACIGRAVQITKALRDHRRQQQGAP